MRTLALALVCVAVLSVPAHAGIDKTCIAYAQVISKQLIHKIRLSDRLRDAVKELRQQGLDRVSAGEACRPPLLQAMRLLGMTPANDSQSQSRPLRPTQERRVHRLGS